VLQKITVAERSDITGQRKGGEAAVAGDICGDALKKLRLRGWTKREREVAMRMHVDEAGRDEHSCCINGMARKPNSCSHRGDTLPLNADIDLARRLGPIDHESAADPDIQHQSLLLTRFSQAMWVTRLCDPLNGTWSHRAAQSGR